MCGIFGIVSATPIDGDEYRQLGELNSLRGNLAFGGLMQTPDGTSIFRLPTPFNPTALPQLDRATLILSHLRAPTGGQSTNPLEIHPFETPDLLLAHNGLLLNHEAFLQWRVHPEINVDSQVILGGIQAYLEAGHTLPEAIATTVGQLDGQQACWLWSKAEQALYLWRVMSPIFIRTTDRKFVFSSKRTPTIDHLLTEGVIYRLDPCHRILETCGTFPFYSPYQIMLRGKG